MPRLFKGSVFALSRFRAFALVVLALLVMSDVAWFRWRQGSSSGEANPSQGDAGREFLGSSTNERTTFSPDKKPRSVVRDLSFVFPSSDHACEFLVRNDTRVRWSLQKVESTCRCTFIVAAADHIDPGETQPFLIGYRAPAKNADDTRNLTLHFNCGTGIRLVVLQLRARCRSALTVVPEELTLTSTAGAPITVDVHNFTDDDWSAIEVRSDVSWLSFVSDREFRASDGPVDVKPRQTWRVTVIEKSPIDAEQTAERAKITVRALPKNDVTKTFIVHRPSPKTGRVKPEMIFFGQVRRGERIAKTAVLQLPGGSRENELPLLRHDLGGMLEVTAKRASAALFLLEIVLNAPEHATLIEGEFVISHPNIGVDISTPIRAKVGNDDND